MTTKHFTKTVFNIFFILGLTTQCVQAHFTTKGPYGGSVTTILATDTLVFVGTANGGVYRTTSSAATSWRYANYSGLLNPSITSLAAIGRYVLAGSAGNGIFRSSDAGNSWTDTDLANKNILALMTAGDHIVAGTNGSGVYLSHDSGSTWEQSNVGLTNLIVNGFAFDGTSIYAATQAGVFFSVDEGDSWTPMNTGLTDLPVLSIVVSGNTIYAATASGVFVTNNATINWTLQNTGLTGIGIKSLTANNHIIYASTHNGVYTSPDQSVSWTAANTGYSAQVNATTVYNGKLFAATQEGGVYRSTSLSAINWAVFNTGLNNLETYAIYNSGTLVIAATNKGLFVSNDLAANYTPSNSGLTDSLHITSIAFGGSKLYVATQNAGVFESNDTGLTWTQVNTGLTSLSIQKLIGTNTYLYAASTSGEVFNTLLTAINWNLTSGLPAGISPTSFATDGSSHVFLGTQAHGVFMCMDNQSWTVSNSGLTNLEITSMVVSGTTLFASTERDGVFKRGLMGTWSTANTGLPTNRITSLGAAGQWVAAGFNGGIYTTYDNGVSWKSPNVTQYLPQYADVTAISFSASSTRIFVATPYNSLYSNGIGELPTGIENNRYDFGQFMISPNPSNGNFSVQFDTKTPVEAIKIYDLFGKQVYESTDFRDEFSATISLENLSGIYFITITTPEGTLSQKIMLN
jgi:hypothetical protein